MPGKIKTVIDQIITQRSQGKAHLVPQIKIKLIMKGIDPDHWHETSPDDHAMFSRVASAAKDMDVTLPADLIVQSTSRNTGVFLHNSP